MTAVYEAGSIAVHHGDCIEVMRSLPDASVEAVVTDPPYALEFMGKGWDTFTPAEFESWCTEWSAECLRVLKPGGHLLAFGGSRTWHRLQAGIEDAGFEIRDSIAWLYGSGFPKSLDVSKAIDKTARVNDETFRRISLVAEVIRTHREAKGMERAAVSEAVVGTRSGACWNWEHHQLPSTDMWPVIKRVLDISDIFDGLIDGTREMFIGAEREVIGTRTTGIGTGRGGVAFIADSENRDITAPATDAAKVWDGWGTALKPAFEPIVVGRKPLAGTVAANVLAHGTGALNIDAARTPATDTQLADKYASVQGTGPRSNSIYGTDDRDRDGAEPHPGGRWPTNVAIDGRTAADLDAQTDAASRYFPTFRYEAKAPSSERPEQDGIQHPTVKPLALMQWLVRLVTPPAGVVLEPFAGSGTTVEACVREGFGCIAIEREADYLPLIVQRLDKPHEVSLFGDLFDGSEVA